MLNFFQVGIDVWKYENSTWTWISGPPVTETMDGLPTVYKYFSEFSIENSPSPRGLAMTWEYAGNLWMFGGYGAAPSLAVLQDVWVYNVQLDMWTWVSPEHGIVAMTTTNKR